MSVPSNLSKEVIKYSMQLFLIISVFPHNKQHFPLAIVGFIMSTVVPFTKLRYYISNTLLLAVLYDYKTYFFVYGFTLGTVYISTNKLSLVLRNEVGLLVFTMEGLGMFVSLALRPTLEMVSILAIAQYVNIYLMDTPAVESKNLGEAYRRLKHLFNEDFIERVNEYKAITVLAIFRKKDGVLKNQKTNAGIARNVRDKRQCKSGINCVDEEANDDEKRDEHATYANGRDSQNSCTLPLQESQTYSCTTSSLRNDANLQRTKLKIENANHPKTQADDPDGSVVLELKHSQRNDTENKKPSATNITPKHNKSHTHCLQASKLLDPLVGKKSCHKFGLSSLDYINLKLICRKLKHGIVADNDFSVLDFFTPMFLINSPFMIKLLTCIVTILPGTKIRGLCFLVIIFLGCRWFSLAGITAIFTNFRTDSTFLLIRLISTNFILFLYDLL